MISIASAESLDAIIFPADVPLMFVFSTLHVAATARARALGKTHISLTEEARNGFGRKLCLEEVELSIKGVVQRRGLNKTRCGERCGLCTREHSSFTFH